MKPEQVRLRYLFSKYFDKTASAEELAEMAKLMEIEENREQFLQVFSTTWEQYQGDGDILSAEKTDEMLNHILATPYAPRESTRPARVRRIFFGRRVAVAAAFLVVAGIGSYFAFFNRRSNPEETVQIAAALDVKAPEKNHATITMADGKKILLDSTASGTLAVQGNVQVTKAADGAIVYKGASTTPTFNTLFNPRGSKVITLTLSDGTKVWLNNESSVHYPVAFSGKERKVTVTGEAYFEVANNSRMPFRVSINDSTNVEVLGTHFNINAYPEEASINTTLLEGSIRLRANRNVQLLNPGQQAQANTRNIRLIKDADVEQAVAWKDGVFSFTDADLPTVMRQLARWYDLDVRYEGPVPERSFNGKIGNTLSLNQVLHILTKTHVNYTVENGNKLTIRP